MNRPTISVRKWQVALLIAAATTCTAEGAIASPDLLLDNQEMELAGTVRYRVVRLLNGARIVVPPFNGNTQSSGRLELIAHRILIDATSSIDATGSGYRGLPNANGEGNGGGRGADVSSDATGGGGHGAPGGPGVLLANCALIPGATGGTKWVAAPLDVTFGGAGAAAGSADGDDGGIGGNGGGAILLRAGKIELDGLLVADGHAGGVYNDDAAGGGAGGGILVETYQFLWAATAQLRANGAPGGTSTDDEGGGGGGGVVRLIFPGTMTGLTIAVEGGSGTCPQSAGSASAAEAPTDPGCLDLDGDGFESEFCGGTDCDDSDLHVHAGVAELCNGRDDNCNGQVDEQGPTPLCASGQCVDGTCVGEDGGIEDAMADAPPDGPATPDSGPTDASGPDGNGPEGGQDAAQDVGQPTVPDGEPESSQTDVTLRGGCSMANDGQGGSPLMWLSLGLAGIMLVRTRTMRRGA